MEHSKIDQTGKTSNTECTDIAIEVQNMLQLSVVVTTTHNQGNPVYIQ